MSNTYTFFDGISPDLRNNLLVNLFQATALISENEILTSDVQEALVKLDIGRPDTNHMDLSASYPDRFKTDYYFEALLDVIPQTDQIPAKLKLYCGAIVSCAVIIRSWDQGEYNAAIKTACRALWTVLDAEQYLIEQFPDLTGNSTGDLESLAGVLKEIENRKISELYKRLNPLKVLMGIYSTKRDDRTWEIATNTIQITEEIMGDDGCIRLQKEVRPAGPHHTGIPKSEHNADQPVQELIVDFPQESADNSTARSSNLKIKKDQQKANHILRGKVNAPSDSNRRPIELFQLFFKNGVSCLNEIYEQRECLAINDIQIAEYESILLILMSLMSGRCRARIELLKLYFTTTKVEDEGILIRRDVPYLLCKPEIKSSTIAQNRIAHDNFHLSLALKTEKTELFLHKLPDELDKHIIYLFKSLNHYSNFQNVKATVNHNDMLRKLTSLPYAPITEVQVAEFLNNSLIDNGIDILLRAYLCGHGPGQTASLYYTQLSTHYLYDIYDDLLEKMNLEKISDHYRQITVVGSALVPTDDYIATRFDQLKTIIKNCEPDRYKSTSYKYHNHYTLYTFRVISLATGHRAVSAPFELITDFDLENGIVTIADEDVGPSLQPRNIPLCKTAFKQLKNYIQYLTEWREHVELYDDDLFYVLGEILCGKLPLFFLFDKDEQMTLLDPSDLMNYRQNIDPLPLNTCRHIFRSYLTPHTNGIVGGTINGEAIDSMAGHANYGQNPNIFTSGFKFNELNKIADLMGEKIIKLGVKAI